MDKKTDVPGMYISPDGALINKDNDALRQYKMKRAKEQKLNMMEEDLKSLKEDISEIKALLQGLAK